VNGVDDVNNHIGVKDHVPCHAFFIIKGGYAIDAWSIDDDTPIVAPMGDLNCCSWIIRNIHIRAGDTVEYN